MEELRSVLVTVRLKPENRKRLEDALGDIKAVFCAPEDRETIASCIQEVDAAILNSDADAQILSGKNLKWIHCCHAGLEKTMRPDIFERNIILTSSSGRSAPALAEHAFMFMLALTYDIPRLMRAKDERTWIAGGEYSTRTGMFGKTVGILGLGKTGKEVAALAKGFHMKVLAWRRGAEPAENVDRLYSADRGEGFGEILRSSDYVVLCVELNDKTWHMINAGTLGLMKETAFLINMGRGALIDEPVLVQALQSGRIAGAGLDTFEKEPLPSDSPLWNLPNVILTPHTTPMLPDREERMLDYVLKNLEAYRTGGAFVNRLTVRDMYSHYRPDR